MAKASMEPHYANIVNTSKYSSKYSRGKVRPGPHIEDDAHSCYLPTPGPRLEMEMMNWRGETKKPIAWNRLDQWRDDSIPEQLQLRHSVKRCRVLTSASP